MAARELIVPALARGRMRGTPVLMYHALTPDTVPAGDPYYCVQADAFREQLRALAAVGRSVIDLGAFWRGESGVAEPGAVVTFDDGLHSDFTLAYPRLVDAGAPAAFFLNTSTVGRPGYLSWPEIREMQGGGMTFQSHAHDHVYLSRLPAADLLRQLEHSKRIIEDRLGAPVEFLAAPFGDRSRRVVETALAVGYRAVCTSVTWLAQPGLPTVNRIAITASATTREVMAFAAGVPGPFLRRALRAGLVYLPKRARMAVRRGDVPALTVEA